MRRAILTLAVLAMAAVQIPAETQFVTISATSTSATHTFTTPRAGVMICSLGANDAHFRLFDEFDTVGAATTAYSPIVAGSATAPVCISFGKPPTQASFYKAISVVCDTAETATIWVYSN